MVSFVLAAKLCIKCCSFRRLTTTDFKELLYLMCVFVFVLFVLMFIKFFMFMIIYAASYSINLYQLLKNIEKNRDYCFSSFNWSMEVIKKLQKG